MKKKSKRLKTKSTSSVCKLILGGKLVALLLLGCAPELTEQDVIDVYKSQKAKNGGYYIEGELKLEDFEIVHQWEASLTYRCGDEICMSTLIREDGKWRVR